MPLSLLDRSESLPNNNDQAGGSTVLAVPAVPSSPLTASAPPSHVVPGAYGYTTPYTLPFYTNAHDASPPQPQVDGADGFRPHPYAGYGPNMPAQAYGFNVLPTMAPRYSMTGMSYASAHPGCISPLDLFTNPAVPSLTVSAPPTSTATSFDHSLFPTGPISPQLSFGNGVFTPDLSLPSSVPTSALIASPEESLRPSLTIGLTIPETPISSDSAPETNLESPVSDSDDEDDMDEGREEEEEETQEEQTASPKVKVDKIKIKLVKGAKGKKDGEEDVKEETAVKKRSRTAQACEKCRVRKARVRLVHTLTGSL